MTLSCQLVLFFFSQIARCSLDAPSAEYSCVNEEAEAGELAQFVRAASAEKLSPPPPKDVIRITRGMRIFIGEEELKLRPMSKAILLLFLLHPEGIALKNIIDHREELTYYYARVTRADDPALIEQRVDRVMDLFSNELNVNLSRVNAALSALKKDGRYHVNGRAGEAKTVNFVRAIVIWE